MSRSTLSFFVVLLLHFQSIYGQTPQAPTVRIVGGSSTTEGGTFEACFAITSSPNGDFIVNVMNNTPGLMSLNVNLTYNATSVLEQCIQNIMAVEDNIFGSSMAVFNIFRLNTFFDGVFVQEVLAGQISITEASVLSLQLQDASYTFLEGTLNEVCVMLDGFIGIVLSVDVTMSGIDDSAASADYGFLIPDVTFSSNTVNQTECTGLTIFADNRTEGAETFNITFMVPPGLVASFQTASPSVATVTIIDIDSNCGPPPGSNTTDLSIVISQPSIRDASGDLVVNSGATATYTCANEDAVLTGNDTLTCVINETDGSVTVSWNLDPPNCTVPATTTSTTDATTTRVINPPTSPSRGPLIDNTNRNIGIGVGVGVGGTFLILFVVILLVALIVRYKKRNRHSKYVLNYNTVYGSENRQAKPAPQNEYEVQDAAPPKTTPSSTNPAGEAADEV